MTEISGTVSEEEKVATISKTVTDFMKYNGHLSSQTHQSCSI